MPDICTLLYIPFFFFCLIQLPHSHRRLSRLALRVYTARQTRLLATSAPPRPLSESGLEASGEGTDGSAAVAAGRGDPSARCEQTTAL